MDWLSYTITTYVLIGICVVFKDQVCTALILMLGVVLWPLDVLDFIVKKIRS